MKIGNCNQVNFGVTLPRGKVQKLPSQTQEFIVGLGEKLQEVHPSQNFVVDIMPPSHNLLQRMYGQDNTLGELLIRTTESAVDLSQVKSLMQLIGSGNGVVVDLQKDGSLICSIRETGKDALRAVAKMLKSKKNI